MLHYRLTDNRDMRIFVTMKIIGNIYPVSCKYILFENYALGGIYLIEIPYDAAILNLQISLLLSCQRPCFQPCLILYINMVAYEDIFSFNP